MASVCLPTYLQNNNESAYTQHRDVPLGQGWSESSKQVSSTRNKMVRFSAAMASDHSSMTYN